MSSSASFGESSSGRISLSAASTAEGCCICGAARTAAKSGRSCASRARAPPCSPRFERRQHLLGAGYDACRQARELRHMNAIGAVGRARRHLVQEDDIALPLLDPHGVASQIRELRCQRRELVIMRREEGAAAVDVVEMLDRGPGDREPVEGRGAAADLIENDERALGRLVEDRRGLDHLDHEGRAPARQIVGGADPAEQTVDDADARRFGRDEGAHLRQHGDERVLPQEGALARHVRAGDEPQPLPLIEVAIIADEGRSLRLPERHFDHGMAAAGDAEARAILDHRPAIALGDGEFGQSRAAVEERQGRRCRRDRLGRAPSPRRRDPRNSAARAPAPCRRRWRCGSQARPIRPCRSAPRSPRSGGG